MDNRLIIGIADMKMAQGQGVLVTYALGSCIGICLHDPVLKLGALIHIMLPLNMETGRKNAFKYADSGMKETLQLLANKGASKARLTAKICGGAKMFEVGAGNLGNIGQRNAESVHMILKREGIRLLAQDVGGTVARTLLFDVETGGICIRSYGKPDKLL
jgi:chemotaxis protein CheD